MLPSTSSYAKGMNRPVSFQHIEPGPEHVGRLGPQVVYELIGVDVDASAASLSRYDGQAHVHGAVQPAPGHVRRRARVHQDTAVYHEEPLRRGRVRLLRDTCRPTNLIATTGDTHLVPALERPLPLLVEVAVEHIRPPVEPLAVLQTLQHLPLAASPPTADRESSVNRLGLRS